MCIKVGIQILGRFITLICSNGDTLFRYGKQRLHACLVISDSVAPWNGACQAPLSMEFSRQEYWSGLPFHSPGDLPNPGIEPGSPGSPALAGRFFPTEPPGKPKGKLSK